jgi:predicted dinucleotide-binding enzyme
VLLAGDDANAKDVVAELIGDMGFDAVDTGGLVRGGVLQEPGSPLYNAPLTKSAAVAAVLAHRPPTIERM